MTSEGMGQYTDMDNINIGHVSNKSIREILAEYGPLYLIAPKLLMITKS